LTLTGGHAILFLNEGRSKGAPLLLDLTSFKQLLHDQE
jgi:hypothetical protein